MNENINLYIRSHSGDKEIDLISVCNLINAELTPAFFERLEGKISAGEFNLRADNTETRINEECSAFSGSRFAKLFLYIADEIISQYKFISDFVESETWNLYSDVFPDFKEQATAAALKGPLISLDDESSVCGLFQQLEITKAETAAYKKKNGLKSVTFTQFKDEILPRCLERYAATSPDQGKEQDAQPKTGQKPLIPKEIEALKSRIPEKHVMPTSKVATMLPVKVTGERQKQGFNVDVSNRGKMNTRVIVTLDNDNGNITFSGRPYTKYDCSVMNTIISLWLYGDESHNITPSMVYRAMNHKTQSEKVSPQAVGAVTKSIEKMRHIFVSIDATDEFAKRGIMDKNGKPVRAKFTNYLLSATEIEVSAGGNTVNAYHIDAEPILFMYSKMNNQYLTVSASLLDVKEVKDNKLTTVSLKNSKRLTVIRDYLIRRIQIMKRDRDNKKPTQSNRILYETLYAETEIGDASKTVKLDARNKSHEILDFFKVKKFISNYEIIKENGIYTAIDIIL